MAGRQEVPHTKPFIIIFQSADALGVDVLHERTHESLESLCPEQPAHHPHLWSFSRRLKLFSPLPPQLTLTHVLRSTPRR